VQRQRLSADERRRSRDISRGLAAAAKKCKRKYRHPWSPVLKKLQQTVAYWKSWLTGIRTKKWLGPRRASILTTIDLSSPPTARPPEAVVQQEIRQAQKALRHAIKQAPALRLLFIEERADAEAAAKNQDAVKILKRIISAEASSSSFNILRRVFGKNKTSALSSIIVPGKEPETWDRIYDQNQITITLIERNQKHFGQAHGTPFTVSPLKNWLGYHGTSISADAVLRGELAPDELAQCTEGAQAILEALQHEIAPPSSVDTRITADDLRKGYKAWRETTSTSPSGQHLG
jgi:hypothetical protein